MKYHTLSLLLAVIVLATTAAGCTGAGTPPTLTGTAWTLVTLRDDSGTLVSVLPGTMVTAEFSADGRVTGSAGCNRYFARYTTSGNRITLTEVDSTKMFCPDPAGIMVQESRFLGHLPSATAFRIDGVSVVLLGGGGEPLLVFGKETG